MSALHHTISAGLRLALLLIVLWLVGCASSQPERDYIRPGTTELIIRQLELRGVENVSERELRGGLATVESPARVRVKLSRFPLIGADARYFNRFTWRQDRERIIAYYRQQGYFHAAIVSESIIEDPDEKTVRIRVTIDEGEPTLIDSIEIEGLDPDSPPSQQRLLHDLPLRENRVFTQRSYRQTRSAIEQRLREAGHAYASVTGRVYVDLDEKSAEVRFFADLGPLASIGDIHIFGLEDIDERSVRQAIRLRPGDRYSPSALRRTQEDIYDLGVFGMVTVLPAHEARDRVGEAPEDQQELDDILDEGAIPDGPGADASDPTVTTMGDEPSSAGVSSVLSRAQSHAESRSRLDPNVPIVVRVQEATGYNLRIGAGVAAESTRQDVRGLLNWTSRNFLGGLRRLEHFNALGYAWSPGLIGPGDLTNKGVILSSELRFQQPQFLERRTNLRSRARISRDVREGFTVWNPSLRLSVDRGFRQHFIIDFSYNLAYFYYTYFDPTLADASTTELGLDFQDQFLLEYFEQTLAYDRRDDVLDPRGGYRVDLTVQQAGQYLVGGGFDFIKPILSAEHYQRLTDFTILALRSRLGTIYDVRRDTGVPIQSRLYSGGVDGMRSFGRQRLSLFTARDEALPIGGLSQFETSLEPRFRLVSNLLEVGDLWGAVFLDSATVLGGQLMVDTEPNNQGVVQPRDVTSSLLHGVGAGMWWKTPVGPVRLDFAYTVSDISEDTRFRRCVDPETYGTDNCVFVPIDEDPIQARILGYGIYLSIGHSF